MSLTMAFISQMYFSFVGKITQNSINIFIQITGTTFSSSLILIAKLQLSLLWQALSIQDWPDDEPTEAEKDFWEIASLECYNHLTEWKSLEYCSTVNIDNGQPADLNKIWSDPFFQVFRKKNIYIDIRCLCSHVMFVSLKERV